MFYLDVLKIILLLYMFVFLCLHFVYIYQPGPMNLYKHTVYLLQSIFVGHPTCTRGHPNPLQDRCAPQSAATITMPSVVSFFVYVVC